MPAHVIYGDSFLVDRVLRDLKEQVGAPEVLEANTHTLSGSQGDLGQLRAVCDAMPFLASRRLVIVEGLAASLDARGGDARGGRRGSARRSDPAGSGAQGKMAKWEGLAPYVEAEMPPTTLLVFLEKAVTRRNPLLESLRSVAQVQEHPTPSGEGLARWIRNRAQEKGAGITPGAIRLLSQYVGGNLWALDNELEKLSLHSWERPIEEGDVRLLVAESREASIFAAVDALLEGRAPVAMKAMHRLRSDGAELPYIVSMIARQLRLVTLARHLLERGHREAELGSRLGIAQEFALKRTLGQARRHSWASLEWLYGRLLDTDLAVKRGRLDQDVALEVLVSEVSGVGAEPRARRR